MWRTRLIYIALAFGTIVIGLLVHVAGAPLGAITRDVLGDALWASMIVWLISALVPRAGLAVRSAIAYLICVAVEVSQLYHAPSLDAIRETRLGSLVLGSGFDVRDLASYALGVLAATVLSTLLERGRIRDERSE